MKTKDEMQNFLKVLIAVLLLTVIVIALLR